MLMHVEPREMHLMEQMTPVDRTWAEFAHELQDFSGRIYNAENAIEADLMVGEMIAYMKRETKNVEQTYERRAMIDLQADLYSVERERLDGEPVNEYAEFSDGVWDKSRAMLRSVKGVDE